MSGFRTALGGRAIVCCVHDKEKRELVDPDEFRGLYRASYGREPDVLHTCACCQNLFAALNDEPRLCAICSGMTVHDLEAPLPEPTGAI